MASQKEPNKGVVLLVDDDLAVRRGVAALLVAANYAVMAFQSGDDFLRRREAVELSNAAMLLDIYMPGIQGLDLQMRLKDDGVDLPIIVMTAHGDVPMAVRAMRNGAVDFLEKPFTADEMIGALDRAFSFVRSTRGKLNETPAKVRGNYESLSPREREVLKGIIEGATNKEIARELDISPRTVEVHRRNLMAKMNAASFAELVRMVVLVDLA